MLKKSNDKKNPILSLIVTIGFFLILTSGYVFDMKFDKPCCSIETFTNIEKNECCNPYKNLKNKGHEDSCGGKCAHLNCITSSVQFSMVFFEIGFKNISFEFLEKEQNYSNSKTNLSFGFHSTCFIPKIS